MGAPTTTARTLPAASPGSRTALSALAWNYGAAVAGALLQLCYTAYTARVVLPESFGAFAAACAALTVLGYVAGAGLTTYLLRAEELTRQTVRTAYRVAVVSGMLCCAAAQLVAPWAAVVWGLPEIDPIVRLFGAFFLTQPASLVAQAALRRLDRARFAALTDAGAQFVGMSTGAALLAVGWSPYGLVAAQVITPTVTLAVAAARLRRCAMPKGTHVAASAVLGVSGAFACYGMIQMAAADVALWAVTRHLGPGPAGQFSRAVLMVTLPGALLAQSLRRAFMPTMARINGEGRTLAGAVPDVLGVASAVGCVSFGVLAGIGPPAAALLLGPGWGQAGALVPVFAVAAPLALVCQIGYAVDETGKRMMVLLRTQLLVLGATVAATALAVACRPSLAVIAVAASLAPGLGHATQLVRWRRVGLCPELPRLLRGYAVHAAIGAALCVSGWVGMRLADDPVTRIAAGLFAMLPTAAACWWLRRRLPLYEAAVARGLVSG
ncbi:MAG: oligosaccharide flippase family protein [Streptomycetaceae bacterium]|nr:oligosaccharide flippase family protein [Streptomycetaceae bacterium]